jgi:PKD repeat protein
MKSTKIFLLAVVVLILVCINPSTASVPVTKFSGTPTIGSAPLTVKFTDKSTGHPAGWAWYFGDEAYTAPWTQMTASAEFLPRCWHNSVVMPDGSIVLMGGYVAEGLSNNTWRSTDMGATWKLMSAHTEWSERISQSVVAMPDSSIVLMGGNPFNNEVWRSTDMGETWSLVTASAEWSPRYQSSVVVMPDGSIVLMGGYARDTANTNDVWRSTDMGATWTQMTASAEWGERGSHTSVAMPDGSIVLIGGALTRWMNDVWRSTNNGATWTQVAESAGWSPRWGSSIVAMPDGSIVLMGGGYGTYPKNDTWRSTDNGATWTQLTASAEWSARYKASSVVMPDGSIVLMGGENYAGDLPGGVLINVYDDFNDDVWRFMPVGSSEQNPSHTYTTPGIYTVALQASNANGYTSTRKLGYITVTPPPSITVTSPNGGEVWKQGTTHTITWDYTGTPGSTVKIELLNGNTLYKVLTSSTSIGKANHGSYSWKISTSIAAGNNYKIRITSKSNSVYTDTSNENFIIN